MKAERGYPRFTITPKAEAAILRGHPWVYDAEVLSVEGSPENRKLVDILSKKADILAQVSCLSGPRSASALSPATPMTGLTRLSGSGNSAGPGSTARA